MESKKQTKTASSKQEPEEGMVKYAVSPEELTKEATVGAEQSEAERKKKAAKKDD